MLETLGSVGPAAGACTRSCSGYTGPMFERCSLALLASLVVACGPEAGLVPRTGVYDVVYETTANDCGRGFAERPSLDAIVFMDDQLTVGFPDFPFPSEKAVGGWLQAWVYAPLERDAGGDGFVAIAGTFFDTWFELDGCRYRRGIAAVLLADDVVQARVTYEWGDAEACTWLPADQAGCTMVRESTFTLREACDDCSLDEVREWVLALYAEEHPPK